jgi:glyoxylase-like metal-dependent hydrolase (beta-lactamase superfamily II)
MAKRHGFWAVLGILALVVVFGIAGTGLAAGKGNGNPGGGGNPGKGPKSCNNHDQDNQIPPQTLKTGFESTDALECDLEKTENAPEYSAWLVESTRFVDVPWGSFQPDKAALYKTTPLIDFPANYGVIKGPDGNLTLYDSGWKQLPYIYDWNNSCCGSPALQQLPAIGLDPSKVTKIVVGHGHWDHAGQLDSFPQATLYIQNEELKQIDFFIDYPTQFNGGHIRAVNTVDPLTGLQVGPPAQACARTPVCGYPPQTLAEIQGKVLGGKAVIVDGRMEIEQGLIIHPAFRGHTYGSQLLQVHTPAGELVFGSDAYSSWTGIQQWLVANIQQTDTIQQFLAYEKCYVLTSRNSGIYGEGGACLAAHEREAYGGTSDSTKNTDNYPVTNNWWTIPGGNCSRAAELALANGEKSHVVTGNVVVNGMMIPAQYNANQCRANVFVRPTGYPITP